jgi:spermidine synthase
MTTGSVRTAVLLSFCTGFLSLSQEILWVRLVSFGHQGRPQAFAVVLVAFLVGISLGAVAGRRFCRPGADPLRAAALVMMAAGALDAAVLLLAPQLLLHSAPPLIALVLVIAATAAAKGLMFPVVHHLGSSGPADRVGRSVSRVYGANVAGSTLGPVVTGFWLLDLADVEVVWGGIALATALTGAVVAARLPARTPGRGPLRWAAVPLLALLTLQVLSPPPVVREVALGWGEATEVRELIQNRHGIIHVLAEERPGLGHVTLGGNIYDGRISVDTRSNANRLERAYLMLALRPRARHALVIGLSSGAWTRAISGFPAIGRVDVVEINPGYLGLIARHPQVSGLLEDPRIRIHVDDGRRWLRAHPDQRFDLVFQNTTFHWRASTTNLLSREHFALVRSRLSPDGVFAVNATGSEDVARTARTVFRHVRTFHGFVYMSDAPLLADPAAEAALRAARVGPAPAFAPQAFAREGVAGEVLSFLATPESAAAGRADRSPPPAVITDLNVLPEYRHGLRPLFGWLEGLLPPTPHDD